MSFAERIKKLREENGYTQQQFADLLDVSLPTVQKWEYGENNPGRRSQKDIKKAFPTLAEVESLFTHEEIMEKVHERR